MAYTSRTVKHANMRLSLISFSNCYLFSSYTGLDTPMCPLSMTIQNHIDVCPYFDVDALTPFGENNLHYRFWNMIHRSSQHVIMKYQISQFTRAFPYGVFLFLWFFHLWLTVFNRVIMYLKHSKMRASDLLVRILFTEISMLLCIVPFNSHLRDSTLFFKCQYLHVECYAYI